MQGDAVDRIEAKEAVKRAREYVLGVFADEDIGNVGLEELRYDDAKGEWYITIGFVRVCKRPHDRYNEAISCALVGTKSLYDNLSRTYKVVTVSDDGKVLGIKNRDIPDVA